MPDMRRTPTSDDSDEERRQMEERRLGHRRRYDDADKQYVRRHGWLPVARARLERNKTKDKSHLKYFSLCAENAIDVLLLESADSLINFDGVGYPEVGFCERDRDAFGTIAINLPKAHGFPTSFEDLVLKRDSQLSRRFYSELPYDLFNLDFTGMCFPSKAPPFSNTLNAIVALIEEMGRQNPPRGFDLLLTFRAERSLENQTAVEILRDNINENRREYQWFDEAFVAHCASETEALIEQYHRFLLLALPKYLGRVVVRTGFKVECTHRYCIPRIGNSGNHYHIISFDMSCHPVHRRRSRQRSLRQPAPGSEVAAIAFRDMLQDLLRNEALDTTEVEFDRQQYEDEVKTLVSIVQNRKDML